MVSLECPNDNVFALSCLDAATSTKAATAGPAGAARRAAIANQTHTNQTYSYLKHDPI